MKIKKAKYRTQEGFIGFRLTTQQKQYIEDASIKDGISMGKWIRRQIFKQEI